jgi:hypothetical protein
MRSSRSDRRKETDNIRRTLLPKMGNVLPIMGMKSTQLWRIPNLLALDHFRPVAFRCVYATIFPMISSENLRLACLIRRS